MRAGSSSQATPAAPAAPAMPEAQEDEMRGTAAYIPAAVKQVKPAKGAYGKPKVRPPRTYQYGIIDELPEVQEYAPIYAAAAPVFSYRE